MRGEIFRLSWFTYVAAILLLLVFLVSPAQFPVVLHKAALTTLGGVIGYWLDRHLFPNARQHGKFAGGYDSDLWMIRRAVIVAACILAMGLAV